MSFSSPQAISSKQLASKSVDRQTALQSVPPLDGQTSLAYSIGRLKQKMPYEQQFDSSPLSS